MGKAKQYTDLAARLVLRKPFLNLKSQLDDLINRAEKAVSSSNSDEAHYLLNQSKKFRRLAYTAFRESRIARGEEFYRIAFFFGQKCLDYIKGSSTNLSDQYRNLEISVRQLLIQAEEWIVNGQQNHLQNLVREAEKHFEEAVSLAEEGKLKMAISRLRLIKRLLYRLFDQAEKGAISNEGKLENNLYSLRSLLDALDREVKNSPDKQKQLLLDKAWQLYREAEEEYESGNFSRCQANVSLCQRFANRLFKMTRTEQLLDMDKLEQQLRETQNLLDLQKDRVYNINNKNVIHIYKESNRILERAQQALTNGRLGIAFQLIQAATRMSARIQRELRSSSKKMDEAALERQYQRIINSITNLENNEIIKKRYTAILTQIKRFAERGKQYLDQGNYILADEYLNTAWEQIKQYTDKWRK
jgi:hypothetical protein